MSVAAGHNELGRHFHARGMFAEAESSYARAIELAPSYVEAHNNLGILYQQTGHVPEAAHRYRLALQMQPDYYAAAANLGCVSEEIGRLDDAVRFYRYALSLNPKMAEIWHNLAGIYREFGWYDKAIKTYEHGLSLDPTNQAAHASLVYCKEMDPAANMYDRLAAKAHWHKQQALPHLPEKIASDPERRLRVGYVSGDFRLHSVAFAFCNVLFAHDRRHFEVTCYSTVTREDAATERFKSSVDRWRRIVGMSDAEVAAQIRADDIDILVDLSGYTAGQRLRVFTMQPAPVQVHAWGYLNGTGIPEIGHILLDGVIGSDAHQYKEKIWKLPCVFHYRPPECPEVGPLPLLKNGHLTFGYLGRWSKVTQEVGELWAEVMKAMPAAKLLLKDRMFASEAERAKALALLHQPAARVIFEPQTGHGEHMAAHNRVDICLDPFPTNGGISSLDALWMGVPIVTLPGERPSSRVCASLMTTLGLPDCVAGCWQDYRDRAVALASDPLRLAKLRAGMRQRIKGTTIGDPGLYVAYIEQTYRAMWRDACRKP